jgi:hypothetical protein
VTNDTDTITLADAAQHFGFTVLTLRAEAERGRLTIYKIGKRYYTTPAAIREMVELCRVQKPRPVSTSTPRADNGLSGTADALSARDALSLTVERLKNSLGDTSRPSTNRSRAETP